jgi:hypothetical protein
MSTLLNKKINYPIPRVTAALISVSSRGTPSMTCETLNPHTLTPEEQHEMIAQAAYYRAEKRGFGDGDPLADWLEAETEIDKQLTERA